jgi:hypothetical protein
LRRAQKQKELVKSIATGSLKPNPANNEIYFSLKHEKKDIVLIRIFDIYGKELSIYKMLSDELQFNTSSYMQGLYFIHVYVNNVERETHRLIIIH